LAKAVVRIGFRSAALARSRAESILTRCFLIDDPIRRFSFNMRSVRPDTAGRFAFVTAPTEQPRNWLPTPTRDQFYLTYRLYNPRS
jgi:hypothetical protein